MRLAVLALAALLLAPDTAAAGCRKVAVREEPVDFLTTRTRVVACGVVLRRAELVDPIRHRARGAHIGGASAAAGRIAWIETRFTKRRRIVEIVVTRSAAPSRVVRRILVARDRSGELPPADVVITPRREISWLAPGRKRDATRLVLDRPGAPPRTLARVPATNLALEDGFTLRWLARRGGFGFYDLPRPGRAACPRRSRYRTIARTGMVRVTAGTYGADPDAATTVFRVCELGAGPDRPVLETATGYGNGSFGSVAAVSGTIVAFAVEGTSRYDPCDGATVLSTLDARTGARLRVTEMPRCGPDSPPDDWTAAVTSDGVMAWVKGDRLLVAGVDGKPAELDRGAIADLRSEGALLHWSRSGEPRSADPS